MTESETAARIQRRAMLESTRLCIKERSKWVSNYPNGRSKIEFCKTRKKIYLHTSSFKLDPDLAEEDTKTHSAGEKARLLRLKGWFRVNIAKKLWRSPHHYSRILVSFSHIIIAEGSVLYCRSGLQMQWRQSLSSSFLSWWKTYTCKLCAFTTF